MTEKSLWFHRFTGFIDLQVLHKHLCISGIAVFRVLIKSKEGNKNRLSTYSVKRKFYLFITIH